MSKRTTIRAEAFKGWFPDVRQPNIVLKFLRSKNALPSRPIPPPRPGLRSCGRSCNRNGRMAHVGAQLLSMSVRGSSRSSATRRSDAGSAKPVSPSEPGRRITVHAPGSRRPAPTRRSSLVVVAAWRKRGGANNGSCGACMGRAIFMQLGSGVTPLGRSPSTATTNPSTGANDGINGSGFATASSLWARPAPTRSSPGRAGARRFPRSSPPRSGFGSLAMTRGGTLTL